MCIPAFGQTAVPTFSLASGNYSGNQTTTLSDTTGGATISWCFTSGSSGPTCTPGTTYTGAISITSSEYLCANATLSGSTSATACNKYSLNNVPLPVQFTPVAGSVSAGTTVTLSTDTVAPSGTTMAIFYTLDGSTPDYTSAVYTGPITIASGTTIKALAGEIGSQTLNDQLLPPNPSSSQTAAAPASYPGWKSVCASGTTCVPGGNNLPANTFGQTLVSTNCAPGNTQCTQFTLTTNSNTTVGGSTAQTNVLYTMVGQHTTACDKCTYNVNKFSVKFSSNFSNAGEFEADQAIFRSSLATPMNSMYGVQCNRALGKWQYLPRSGSWVTSSIACSAFLTPGVEHTYVMLNHSVLSDTSCSASGTALPTQHYDFGIFDGVKTALGWTNCTYPLQAGFSSAVLHQYQIDQAAPSASSTATVDNSSETALYDPSAISTATYTVATATATPTIGPAPGNYTSNVTVTLSDTTPSSTIYYTTDGSTPTTASTVYTTPFTITASSTIKTMAAASGLTNSAVASGTYTVTPISSSVTINLNGMQRMKLTMQGSLIASLDDDESGFNISQILTDPAYNSVTTNTLFLGTVPIIQSATAPTGACSAVEWDLSNEPHISFCNGTVWSTLI